MKNYLSFGGGVNSTAMYLMLLDQGYEFGKGKDIEAVYVDHGCDWPETREYVKGFAKRHELTIIKPDVEGFDNLYDYLWHYRMIPTRMLRLCTDKFKVRQIIKYVDRPCFQFIGIDAGEAHRATISSNKGIELRYPLIEENITRQGCKDIIANHGEIVPMKSGCWFCAFQRKGQWRQLRKKHPDLFCKAIQLENQCETARKERKQKHTHGSPQCEFVV